MGMIATAKVYKSGPSSLAVIIPKIYLKISGLKAGDKVDILEENGRMIIVPTGADLPQKPAEESEKELF
jgi:antitoxin component of MazEF toxin-antitoxin module